MTGTDRPTIARVVTAIDGPVVLVGHSYGGAVITQASAGRHEKPSFLPVPAQDNSIPPDAERSFAKRMGATTEEIDGSHTAFVARPAEVARFILRAC
jgi:pimeloyl-ACP methyl ester carboxylesterase